MAVSMTMVVIPVLAAPVASVVLSTGTSALSLALLRRAVVKSKQVPTPRIRAGCRLTRADQFSYLGGTGILPVAEKHGQDARATQCQGLIGSGFDVIFCEVEGCVQNVLWENGGELTAHEKAVPAMIGGHNTKPHHGRNGKWPTKEAGPPTTAGEIVDRLDARVSHAGIFQASPKCFKTQEMPALGLASFALHHHPDDLLLWRQPPGKV